MPRPPVEGAQLWANLRDLGLEMGLVGIGVTDSAPFAEVREEMERRRDAGLSASLTFTFLDPDRATDVSKSFPWGRSIVVGAASYASQSGHPGPPDRGLGRIARFSVEDYYPLVRRPLQRVADELGQSGFRAEVVVDDNRLVDRAAAVRAGIGWWGKNTMVLTPGYGPWILLGSVITDAVFPPTGGMRRGCGTCEACLPACPTGALIEPGVLDANLCIAYWLQAPGVIPYELRAAVADRVYGCDDCLEACPPGTRALAPVNGQAARERVDLARLLSMSDRELLRSYGRFYIPRNDPKYLRRNALVALGNTGTARDLGLLARYLRDDEWLLRAHAAWAIGAIGGDRARGMVEARIDEEPEQRVRRELTRAQDTLLLRA